VKSANGFRRLGYISRRKLGARHLSFTPGGGLAVRRLRYENNSERSEYIVPTNLSQQQKKDCAVTVYFTGQTDFGPSTCARKSHKGLRKTPGGPWEKKGVSDGEDKRLEVFTIR